MAYIQSISSQAAIFCRAVGFGFLLGGVYDLLRFFRLLTGSRCTAVWDVGFGALSGVLTFLYALTQNGGKLRVHFLCAICIGFCVWLFSAGLRIRKAQAGILHAVCRISQTVRRPFLRISSAVQNVRDRWRKSVKKVVKKLKILLKSGRVMVYNTKQ